MIDRIKKLLAPKKQAPTFRDFARRWMDTYPAAAGNRETTTREKEIHLKVHLVPAFGGLRLDEIQREHLDRLFASMRQRERPLAPKSIKNVSATLRRLLNSAVEWGELAEAPPLPRVKVPDGRFDFYVKDEVERLLTAASERDYLPLLFAIHTGCRAGEQRAMRWQSIDFAARKVIIRESLAANATKVGPTKSGKERKVPLTDRLGSALAAAPCTGELVFARTDGRHVPIDWLRSCLARAAKAADLRRIRWHDLRHTYASNLVMAGVPVRRVQDLLGHASISMTEKYAHLAPGGSDEVMRALDGGQAG